MWLLKLHVPNKFLNNFYVGLSGSVYSNAKGTLNQKMFTINSYSIWLITI